MSAEEQFAGHGEMSQPEAFKLLAFPIPRLSSRLSVSESRTEALSELPVKPAMRMITSAAGAVNAASLWQGAAYHRPCEQIGILIHWCNSDSH
ncbi:hypothetical protein [Teichococcus vastitatis]|uniref:Uncharacterized protein n=1 Tax=Teichococcus vastitatis TaxID=2307076 RepID=A0ABS9W6N7_9PROT|nr:hypothetical protein [Pseudoroseomonas vastitatis]MCI0754969.1 hypothetical protein [Pseudoroseomonas vastitatis]